MVELFRRVRELPAREIAFRENPDDLEAKARVIARAVREELENRGGLVDIREAKSILAAEGGSPAELVFCASCGFEVDAAAAQCPQCGSTKATSSAPYECARCATPISDLSRPGCPNCGHDKAIRRGQ